MEKPQMGDDAIFHFDASQYTERVGIINFFGSRVKEHYKFDRVQVIRSPDIQGPTFPIHEIRPFETRQEAAHECARQYGGPTTRLLECRSERRRLDIGNPEHTYISRTIETDAPFMVTCHVQHGKNGKSASMTWWFLASSWSPPVPIRESIVPDFLADDNAELFLEGIWDIHLCLANRKDEEVFNKALKVLRSNSMLHPDVIADLHVADLSA